jgi:hypothetical protein
MFAFLWLAMIVNQMPLALLARLGTRASAARRLDAVIWRLNFLN